MTITDSTIYSSVWTDIRTKLVASSITVDSTTVSIRAKYNDKYTKPQVILNPVDKDEIIDKFSATEGKKEITVTIDVYYKTSAGVDSIAEQIEASLKANDISGIEFQRVSSDTGVPLTPNESKFHFKAISVQYLRE